ncbi:hypothetical protein KSP35_14550 [Aquihabitans sp. G128]|uniref:hypothetical protein n=1 Tax=Aquihabitans sp. G128 TaxID=2849779 RepID=UPI001C22882A|nr:hypothetical protein [Aquihabitans sp. G128]QXC59601.1 hypothetical protein KSP35_14550 [Aquihabitans sp. G128]
MTTTTAGRDALATELEGPVPEALDPLADERLAELADLLAAAKARQAEDLAAGAEEALRFVPRLLRGPFRRALGA